MWRRLVATGSRRHHLAEGLQTICHRTAQVFELHQSRLLVREDVIELLQKMILVGEPAFEFYNSVFHVFPVHGMVAAAYPSLNGTPS